MSERDDKPPLKKKSARALRREQAIENRKIKERRKVQKLQIEKAVLERERLNKEARDFALKQEDSIRKPRPVRVTKILKNSRISLVEEITENGKSFVSP